MINLKNLNEEAGQIVPAKNGEGNIVFLKSFYFHEADPENPSKTHDDKIIFKFVDKNQMEFEHRMLNPIDASTEKQMIAGLTRIMHLVGAFMKQENYVKFGNSQYDTIVAMLEGAKQLMIENWQTTPAKLMVVYNDKGYLTLPYGVVISTELKRKVLAFDSQRGKFFLTKSQQAPKPDDEFGGGASADDDF